VGAKKQYSEKGGVNKSKDDELPKPEIIILSSPEPQTLDASVLHSLVQVREGDEVWDPDRLWGEIKRELQLEAAEREALTEGNDGAGAGATGGGAGASAGLGRKSFGGQEMTSTKM
jgi:hypothetical protein